MALLVSQASMLLAFRRDEDSPLTSAVLAGSLIVLAVLLVLAIVEATGPDTDVAPKVYATLAVLYLLCALLHPVCGGRRPKRSS
jgi:hypothetical protein